MSNERIDLTDGALRKQIHEHTGIYHEPTVEDVETILHGIKGIGLIAELKRCYERLDAQKRQFSEIFELCSEYIDPRDVSEMTIQQGRILTEIWSMASYAKDEEELPDFTASE